MGWGVGGRIGVEGGVGWRGEGNGDTGYGLIPADYKALYIAYHMRYIVKV